MTGSEGSDRAELERLKGQLSLAERRRLRPDRHYLAAMHSVSARVRKGRDLAVRRRLESAIFADVFDPARPEAGPWAYRFVHEFAINLVRRRAARYARRYGDGIVDAALAPGLADEALMVVGRAMSAHPGRVRDPLAYVKTTVRFQLASMVDDEMKFRAPGVQRHYRLQKRYARELRREQPGLSRTELEALAMAKADAKLAEEGLTREPVLSIYAEPLALDDPTSSALFTVAGVQEIDRVARAVLTPSEYLTYVLMRREALTGMPIDWETERGITPESGKVEKSRVRAKLKAVLGGQSPPGPVGPS